MHIYIIAIIALLTRLIFPMIFFHSMLCQDVIESFGFMWEVINIPKKSSLVKSLLIKLEGNLRTNLIILAKQKPSNLLTCKSKSPTSLQSPILLHILNVPITSCQFFDMEQWLLSHTSYNTS